MDGAATSSITTLSIMTPSITTFDITALSLKTLSITIFSNYNINIGPQQRDYI